MRNGVPSKLRAGAASSGYGSYAAADVVRAEGVGVGGGATDAKGEFAARRGRREVDG